MVPKDRVPGYTRGRVPFPLLVRVYHQYHIIGVTLTQQRLPQSTLSHHSFETAKYSIAFPQECLKTAALDSPYHQGYDKELLPTRLADWELSRLKGDPPVLKGFIVTPKFYLTWHSGETSVPERRRTKWRRDQRTPDMNCYRSALNHKSAQRFR